MSHVKFVQREKVIRDFVCLFFWFQLPCVFAALSGFQRQGPSRRNVKDTIGFIR